MEWEAVVEYLKGAVTAHLATVSAEGEPHVSVVMAGVDADVVWFATRASSGKARNIRANPRVALMWQPQAEIYLRGDAEVLTDLAEKQRVWEAGILPYEPAGFWGTPDNPDWVLVRVKPTSALVLAQGGDGLARLTWRRTTP